MRTYSHDNYPVSEYKVIFSLDIIDEEKILYVENQITSSGYAKLNPITDYNEGTRTWLLDWKNNGDNPQEIIRKLKKYNLDIYKKIKIERMN
jgi:hypothetical protein